MPGSAAVLKEHRERKVRLAAAYYRFQDERIRVAESAARLRIALPGFELYTFRATAGGPLTMVRRPRIAGGGPGQGPLHCWMEAGPDVVVLHVEGEVDLATAPILANAVAAAFAWSRAVVVDFADVRYIDGSGLGVLRRAAEGNAARLAVASPSPHVRMLFDIVGLTEMVPLVASVEAARVYLRSEN